MQPGIDTPLFPAAGGGAPSKASVVSTFEALGSLLGQPLVSETGIRMFGGHTARVTGAQALAAVGVEINKIRILARRSGESILRYVADAPLKSLRSDLFTLTARTAAVSASSSATPAAVSTRLRKLEAALSTLRMDVDAQAGDVVALATGFARTDDRVFIQNTVTATVHLARSLDGGHASCGWRFATARRSVNGPAFRVISSLVNLPGTMLCERCMPTERAVALSVAHMDVTELSGDES
jgi:outer membrane murein-binding lipoprotein Lpp